MNVLSFSYKFPLRKTATGAVIALAATFCSVAAADVQVAAFADGRGFKSLMAGDVQAAARFLPARTARNINYSDSNNLCVLKILRREGTAAVQTCQTALRKLSATSMKRKARQQLKAEIYTNLAVAQILAGNELDARRSQAKALSLTAYDSQDDSNAANNEFVFQSTSVAAN